MSRPRTLVAYYSRSGHTRDVARELAAALDADAEEIAEPSGRDGVVGYVRSALEAIWGASAQIDPPRRDPGLYDLVVVGTPVWYAAVSTPVRTYLWVERERLPKVAFFLTHGGFGSERVFGQMAALAGKHPAAELALRVRDIEAGSHRDAVAAFARSLRPAAERAGAAGGRRSRRPGRRARP